jgi:hypothetical protein
LGEGDAPDREPFGSFPTTASRSRAEGCAAGVPGKTGDRVAGAVDQGLGAFHVMILVPNSPRFSFFRCW